MAVNDAVAKNNNALKAAWLLMLATFLWGTSFLLMKSLVMVQQQLVPEAGTWMLAALSITFRFGIAAAILAVWQYKRLKRLTKLELYEGVGLGVIGGTGLLLQMDGVNYTHASTSAFLTQSYCVFIPLWVALRSRRWPSRTILTSSAMVLAGVTILSEINFTQMRLGRGELETLLASLFFTAQILWLERPKFAKNDPHNFTIVMFAVTAVIFLPIPFWGGNAAMIAPAYGSAPAVMFSLLLMGLCTLVAYSLMNHWQPCVPATQAGLIYCSEPVFTSLFALFLPGWFSILASIHYPNESLTVNQVVGGGLITAANILILFQAARAARPKAGADTLSGQKMKPAVVPLTGNNGGNLR